MISKSKKDRRIEMHYFRTWFRSCKIKKQIQLAILTLAILSTVLLGILSYMFSKHIIEQNYKDDFSYNLEISNEVTNIQLHNIIESTRNLLTNVPFISILKNSKNSSDKYFSSTESHALEAQLSKVMAQEPLIVQILVFDKQGKAYSYTSNSAEGGSYKQQDITEEEWVRQIEQAQGKEIFYSDNILNSDQTKQDIYMAKYLIAPDTYEGVGYLLVKIRSKLFDKAFGPTEEENGVNSFMVVNELADKANVYYRGNEDYRHQIEEEIKWKIRSNQQSATPANNKFIYATVQNDLTGWQLVSIANKNELTKDSNLIGGMILLFILLLVALGMWIANIISGRIYQPLQQLEGIIDEVGEGNRNITDEFDDSEIGQIGNRFKQMVNNNLELRERLLSSNLKEREAELLLLQAQINPHFLYNTLDSLYCMAIIHNMDEMAQMVDALSRTFRLSLNKGNKLIQVQDEIEHVKSYMEVQNYRYHNRFSLDVQIEEACAHLYILKFILQPFVENAMYHGLEPKVGKGSIRVTGRQDGQMIIFTIEDDGIGIADMSVIEQGYAVQNVRERIRLYYGEDSQTGVSFSSKEQVGTCVTVTVLTSYQGGEIVDEERSYSR
ncbi:MAG: histidine kinase [Lachnospiraceae bacterium]